MPTKRKYDPSRKALSTLYYYIDGHVSPVSVPRRAIIDENKTDPDTQVVALCRLMARALPANVVLKFCELTGANYETVLWLGTGTHESEETNRRQRSLTEEQTQEVVASRYVRTAKELAAQYGVATPTIHAIWAKYGGSSKLNTKARPPGT